MDISSLFLPDGRRLDSLKVVDLRVELQTRGLSKTGAKKDLVGRLANYMLQHGEGQQQQPPQQHQQQPQQQLGVPENDYIKEYMAQQQQQQREAEEMRRQLEAENQLRLKQQQELEEQRRLQEAERIRKQQEEAEELRRREEAQRLQEQEEALRKQKQAEEESRKKQEAEVERLRKEQEAEKLRLEQELKRKQQEEAAEAEKLRLQQEEAEKLRKRQVEEEQRRLKLQQELEEQKRLEEAEKIRKQKEEAEELKRRETERKLQEQEEALRQQNQAEDSKKKVQETTQKQDNEEEEEEDVLSVDNVEKLEPEEVVPLRKIGNPEIKRHKRQWGSTSSADPVVSSQTLKDLVPDIKPLLKDDAKEQQDEDSSNSPPESKKIRIEVQREKSNEETSSGSKFVKISNLVRPFTVNQLMDLLKRTGDIAESGFAINKIKSDCVVEYSKASEAEETISALNGVKWPQSNPKTLIVQEAAHGDLEAMKAGSMDRVRPSMTKSRRVVEEPPKKRVVVEAEKEKEVVEAKSLEELFNKTKSLPNIYWKMAIPLKQ